MQGAWHEKKEEIGQGRPTRHLIGPIQGGSLRSNFLRPLSQKEKKTLVKDAPLSTGLAFFMIRRRVRLSLSRHSAGKRNIFLAKQLHSDFVGCGR
jgi:hypothetical protein